MNNDKRPRLIPKKKVRPYQGRSAVYAWLRAHHAAIEARRTAVPCLWAELALDMEEDGVLDGKAGLPGANNIRMTWVRVARDVAAEAAAKLPRRSKPPSRMSPDWRPEAIPPAVRPAASVPALCGPASLVPARSGNPMAFEEDPATKARVDAYMDGVMEQLLDLDRRRNGL